MIRLLHTESSMNLGGQELRVLLEMEKLEGHGYSSVLAARPGSRILEEAKARGLRFYPVEMRGSVDPMAVWGLVGIISKEKIDIINAHGSKDGWSAGIAGRITGRKVFRSRHVANPVRAHFFGRLVYGPLCDRIITTSESIRRGMAEREVDPGKITSVPTGVDTGRFNPGVEKGRLRAELWIGADTPLVGMVAVLRGDKGPDVFVEAAEAVLESMPEAFFVLAGDGWMRPRLEEKLAGSPRRDRIRLLGYRRDIPHILADLDLLCLPARAPEGVPQAILQAHAMKVPVIASEVGGITEVAINGNTALTVPPGDHGQLAGAVAGLLRDRKAAGALAEAGYKLVNEKYTLDRMVERMDGIYREVLGRR